MYFDTYRNFSYEFCCSIIVTADVNSLLDLIENGGNEGETSSTAATTAAGTGKKTPAGKTYCPI